MRAKMQNGFRPMEGGMAAYKSVRNSVATILLGLILALTACGGADGGLFEGLSSNTKTFWTLDWTTNAMYQTTATKVGEGTHCYVYLEKDRDASRAAIDNLVAEFDNRIYPIDTAFFGSEPNTGADGDPKIYILLLDIRQTVTPTSGFIAGYFSSLNEYPRNSNQGAFAPSSNQKEMLYADIVRQTADSPFLLRVLAHEFQHMIHWQQKDHLRLNLLGSDDTWLNEAMSEAAAILCYGTDPDRVSGFDQKAASELSLTGWGGNLEDYYKVAMWSQYILDRYPANLFRRALQSPLTGMPSIDNALTGTGKTFIDVFNEWTVANLVAGNPALFTPIIAAAGHPEWSYLNISMPDLFYPNPAQLYPLPRFSSIYARFDPSVPGGSGTVQWQPVGTNTNAVLIDLGGGTINLNLVPGTTYSYTDNAFLLVRNSTLTDNVVPVGDNVASLSLSGGSPAPLRAKQLSTSYKAAPKSAPSGNRGYCGTPAETERCKWLQDGGYRVEF